MPEDSNDVPRIKQGILENANVGGPITIDSINQNINYPAPPPPLTSTPSNIPYLGASTFVGRGEELKQIHQFLQQLAVSAIAGMGGVGKTELAVQYFQRYRNDYSAGLCWFSARAADVGAQILNFASRLQLVPPEQLGIVERIAYIWQHWPVCPATTSNKEESGDVLLVFDDVENYEQVQPFLPLGLPRFKVLITSRNDLGRNVHHIPLDVLPLEKALELLASFTTSRRVEVEKQSAEELCAWLGRLPLGIELVGQYLADRKAITLAKMLEQLKKQKLSEASLQRDEQDPDNSSFTARRGVAAAFELSWNTLNDEQKELGCLLSLFAPAAIGWSLVEKVIGQSRGQRILNAESQEKARIRLVKSHLLQSAEDGQSFRLHPLLWEFFRAKLESSYEADGLKREYCWVLIGEARKIPLQPTREVVERVLPTIPHLAEVATTLLQWVKDEDLINPFVGLGRFYEGQGAYAQAQPWFEQSLSVCQERLGEEHPFVAVSLNNLAMLYRDQGKYDRTELLLLRALEMGELFLGQEHPVIATNLNNLAEIYRAQGKYDQAEPLLIRALEMSELLSGRDHSLTATSLNNLAELYRAQGKYDKAEPLLMRALEIDKRFSGEEHPSVATGLNNLAELYRNQGEYDRAEPLYVQALKMNKQLLGEEHPFVATSLNNLAGLYQSQGQYEKAEPFYAQALELFKRLLGEDHPDVATSLNNLATLYKTQGHYERAEPLLVQALEMFKRLLGAEHPTVASSLNNLATLYDSQGHYDQAESFYVQALEMNKRLLGEKHVDVASGLNNLAGLCYSKGQYEEAEPLYTQALEILVSRLGPEHPNTDDVWQNYTTFLKKVVQEHPMALEHLLSAGSPVTQQLLQQMMR
jgi:tetratricopeptide (TPR) repeat protein